MAAFIICCPKCSTRYRIDESNLGKKIRCKKCQTTFTILSPKITTGAAAGSTQSSPKRTTPRRSREHRFGARMNRARPYVLFVAGLIANESLQSVRMNSPGAGLSSAWPHVTPRQMPFSVFPPKAGQLRAVSGKRRLFHQHLRGERHFIRSKRNGNQRTTPQRDVRCGAEGVLESCEPVSRSRLPSSRRGPSRSPRAARGIA